MSIQIPGAAELDKIRDGAEGVIDSVTKVIDFVEAHGSWIPGIQSELASLQKVDDALKAVKALIDHI